MSTLSERLKDLRKEKGLTQMALADEIGKSRFTIADWERAKGEPNSEDLKAIADFFAVTTDYLLGRTRDRSAVKRLADSSPVEGLRAVPILRTIPAGMPLSAVEDESEKLLLPEELLPQGHVFLLRVRGDAMEDETIFDGDLVLINADEPVVDMDIGAVSVDDEVTLKKVHYFDGYVVLIPANSKYDPCPPKRAGEVRILGRWESTIHHRRR